MTINDILYEGKCKQKLNGHVYGKVYVKDEFNETICDKEVPEHYNTMAKGFLGFLRSMFANNLLHEQYQSGKVIKMETVKLEKDFNESLIITILKTH